MRVITMAVLAVCAAGVIAVSVRAQAQPQTQPQTPYPVVPASDSRDPTVRRDVAGERPDRQRAAMLRALFASDDALPVTLVADFTAVNRDRDPESTKVFPATLIAPGRAGDDRIAVNIRTRGHSRRLSTTCTFAPIRIEFTGRTEGTVFEGHKSLKLGTHCRDVDLYEQYVYREYLAYKVFNRITPRSFRARLATATYVDAASNAPVTTRAGLFLEDDDDVARRLGGETTEVQGLTFARVDPEAMTVLGLFEFMIGNTDMSLSRLHNIITVRASNGVVYPVPYDFDYSGVVNARYAVPAKVFSLATVRERLYRGPCRTSSELTPILARLSGMRDAILSLYDTVPALDPGYRKNAKDYLDDFFRIIEKPGDVRRAFIDGCNRKTM